MIGESRGRSDRFAVDAVFALDGSFVGRGAFNSGAERGKPERALDFGGNRPGAVALVESDLLDRRAAKTAAGARNEIASMRFVLPAPFGP